MANRPPVTNIVIDPEGDLTLRVGSPSTRERAEIVVCSGTLCRTSTVFRRLLATKPRTGRWVVHLPVLEVAPLAAVLNVIHGRHGGLGGPWTTEKLYQIIKIVKQYQLHDAMKISMGPWFQAARTEMVQISSTIGKMISPRKFKAFCHIAWELGESKGFAKAASQLLRFLVVNKTGHLGYPDKAWLDNSHRTYRDFIQHYAPGIQDEKNGGVKLSYRDLENPTDFGPGRDLVSKWLCKRTVTVSKQYTNQCPSSKQTSYESVAYKASTKSSHSCTKKSTPEWQTTAVQQRADTEPSPATRQSWASSGPESRASGAIHSPVTRPRSVRVSKRC